MATLRSAAQRARRRCRHLGLRTKLADDLPGLHTYVLACPVCHQEHGEETVEYHHGPQHTRRSVKSVST